MARIKTTLITPPQRTAVPPTAINLFFRLASSFKFKKGSETAAKNGDAASSPGSADPPPPLNHLLLPSEETIAGMKSTTAVGNSKAPSNCGGE